jgi:hypothetical protein
MQGRPSHVRPTHQIVLCETRCAVMTDTRGTLTKRVQARLVAYGIVRRHDLEAEGSQG